MTRHLWPALVAALVLVAGLALAQTPAANPKVLLKTSLGDITIELYPAKAPITVKNFLEYVNDKFYDGTIFHRVIPGFMIQGGGYTADMGEKPTKGAIKNEAGNGLKNDRGTIAMARLPEPDTATAQFFINLVNTEGLNHKDNTPEGFGYCVFGKVVAGMDVVDKIAAVPTGTRRGHANVPREPITILSATVVK
jgi:peptidyl-prolyl cis-trans isomerase A (cyclophilin A)